MAHPDHPAGPARPARRVGTAPDRSLGGRIPAAHRLSPLPHGAAAPQAGRQPGPAPPSAHRTRHGLSLPALTGRSFNSLATFRPIGSTRLTEYAAKCEARDLTQLAQADR